jgi:hypothetical protein
MTTVEAKESVPYHLQVWQERAVLAYRNLNLTQKRHDNLIQMALVYVLWSLTTCYQRLMSGLGGAS